VFVHTHRFQYSIAALCRNLNVSKAGYYAWRKRILSARVLRDEQLRADIRFSHERSGRRYGRPNIHADLKEMGIRISGKHVARLMREENIVGKRRSVSRRVTAAAPCYPAAPNLLKGKFHQSVPNRAWVSDITYLPTGEGFLYLATVLDLYSRRIVGWSMDVRINAALVIDALASAVRSRKPPNGLIVHTDRGSQYGSREYRSYLQEHNIKPSMSEKGKCWQNAVAESFFATLKTEAGPRSWKTRDLARADVFEFIETWYNRQRRHSTLGYISPVRFEKIGVVI
jgi:putative transposase